MEPLKKVVNHLRLVKGRIEFQNGFGIIDNALAPRVLTEEDSRIDAS
jgi:hypothetical protein